MEYKNDSLSNKIFDIAIVIISVLITLIMLYPLYFVVIASISDPVLIGSGEVVLLPKGIGFEGYEYIFRDGRIGTGYLNTVIYTVFGTLLAVLLTIPGAYALSRKDMPFKKGLMKYMVFTMYFSGGLIPTYLIVKELGMVDTRMAPIVLGSFSVYNLIIARTYFVENIPLELQEASEIDGCSIARFFWSIVLPLSKPIIAIITLYYMVGHWNSFFTALIYINSNELYPLQLILRDILISGQILQADITDPDMLAELMRISETIRYGVIIVATVPLLAVYPFVQKYFVKGIMIGSIKG